MKYSEYLTTAQRHLKSCQAFYNSIDWRTCGDSMPVLRDIYYLTGYIFEAVVVYVIYKKGGFDENTNIKDFDKEFTERTDVDFFARNRYLYKIDDKTTELTEEDKEWLKQKKPLYAVQSHKFKCLLYNCCQNQKNKCCIHPLRIPYITDSSDIRPSVKALIDMWDVCLRYSTDDPKDPWNKEKIGSFLNKENVGELLKICDEILGKIRSVKFFGKRNMP